jgi:hypothetical protein
MVNIPFNCFEYFFTVKTFCIKILKFHKLSIQNYG